MIPRRKIGQRVAPAQAIGSALWAYTLEVRNPMKNGPIAEMYRPAL